MMDDLLRQFAAGAGLSDLALDARGACSLSIDGASFTLQYYAEGAELYFVHRFVPLPPPGPERERLFAFLLDRNCFFQGVGAGVLGALENGDGVYYTARLSVADLSYEAFERYFQAVVNVCARLRAEWDRRAPAPADVPAPAEAAPSAPMLRV